MIKKVEYSSQVHRIRIEDFHCHLSDYNETSLYITFSPKIEHRQLRCIHQLAYCLRQLSKELQIKEIVPAFASLLIQLKAASFAGRLKQELLEQFNPNNTFVANPTDLLSSKNVAIHDISPITKSITVPVCYDPELGIDISTLARSKNMSIEKLISLHTEPSYLVCMLGFLPGFMYLSGLHPKLATSRRSEPRTKVEAGSIAIGGSQTGIYPIESPGGWHIIGKTPLKLNDFAQNQLAIANPMDQITFKSICFEEYQRRLSYRP